MTGVSSYSTTASENIAANTGIVWDEGMAPAQVNNAARQNMADTRLQWNDAAWFLYGNGSKTVAHTYASSTSTTIATDVTSYYHAGRRIRAVGSGTGTIYGKIASSSYSAPNTTINYTWDSGSLSNETLTVYASVTPRTGNPLSPAPSRQVLTSGSSATYTTPGGCRQLRIRMIGGGGAGGNNSNIGSNGNAGSDSIFNGVHAGAGSAGTAGGITGAGGTSATGTASLRITGNCGQQGAAVTATTGVSGPAGVPGPFGGAPISGSAALANTGAGGGGGGGSSFTGNTGGPGGSGEYVELVIDNPSASYTYTIGAGGTVNGGVSGAFGIGGNGGSGLIIVDEIYV